MNYLEGSRVYFSGPIEHSEKDTDNWRPSIRKALSEEFGIRVFDPTLDPKQKLREEMISCKEKGNFAGLSEVMRKFVRTDLAIVDRSDFILASLPYKVPTIGTHHEIILANQCKKPTLLVCEQGIAKIPEWYFGFIPLEFMFSSFDDVINYLKKIHSGEIKYKKEYSNRWDFLYSCKENCMSI